MLARSPLNARESAVTFFASPRATLFVLTYLNKQTLSKTLYYLLQKRFTATGTILC